MSEEEATKEIPGSLETIGVLVFSKDRKKILMVQHNEKANNRTGIWGIPAGRIELGESPKEAAVRELEEETGLEASEDSIKSFEGNYFSAYIERSGGKVRHAKWTIFNCDKFVGKLRPGEETVPEWVDINTIKQWEKEERERKEEQEKELKPEEREGLKSWDRTKLMPNIENAINNYLQSLEGNESPTSGVDS